MDNKTPEIKAHELDIPAYHVNPDVKLPDWVRCFKCNKGPDGYNWLKPVSPDPECRKLIHLECIEKGLSRTFANQVGGRGQWPA